MTDRGPHKAAQLQMLTVNALFSEDYRQPNLAHLLAVSIQVCSEPEDDAVDQCGCMFPHSL
jgi:hypothetical protein